jgi:hypothetical protein
MKGMVCWFAGVAMLCMVGPAAAVMERSEVRKQRYFARPITAEVVNEQQAAADIFLRLGLLPKVIRVADIVFTSHTTTP